jgi:hypothetical protein
MDPIEAAIAAIESLEPGEDFSYQAVAKKFNINRTTLSRRHQSLQAPRTAQYEHLQKLSPHQEAELVQYIEELTKRSLPPTREMVQNFASSIARERVSESWVTRFINRHKMDLIPKWSNGMERSRHIADSYIKYRDHLLYLHQNITDYQVPAQLIFNMDEKGFMLGNTKRSKRVFSRRLYERGEVTAHLSDGSREWFTVLACICADGGALPPAVIYEAPSGNIQSAWVDQIEENTHQISVTTSPSGWSNDEIGLAWLEQVFDRYTKERAHGDYRLLIMDGHGSHITRDFINYCDQNRILIYILPPHSTHRLQPLDVVIFKPLSQAYTHELTEYLHSSHGSAGLRKREFLPFFYRAWTSTMTRALIAKSFKATGIYPMDTNPVLKKFTTPPPPNQSDQSTPSRLSDSDLNKIDQLIQAAVKDTTSRQTRMIRRSMHRLQAQNKLLKEEIKGLTEAVRSKQKHTKKSKALPLEQANRATGGATFWSPRKIKEARDRREANEQQELELELQKARRKQEKAEEKISKKQQLEQKRRDREVAKEAREKEKAEQAAERERQRRIRDSKKAVQTTQRGKRKASATSGPKNKRQRPSVGEAHSDVAGSGASAPPPKTTRRGRNITLPDKFK